MNPDSAITEAARHRASQMAPVTPAEARKVAPLLRSAAERQDAADEKDDAA